MQVSLTSVPYRPASPLTGAEGLAVYRGKNVKLRGLAPYLFYKSRLQPLDLSEPIPTGTLTGTIAFSPVSNLVTGTGTSFWGELHLGSMLFASNAEVLVVTQVISDTLLRVGRLPQTTQTVATATISPILFALDINRGSLLHGNAVLFDKGTILCVGSGTLRINGSVLSGDSLTAIKRLQVALYDAVGAMYDVQDVGFDDVPDIANTDITVVGSGGTKNMSAGYYAFRVAYYSTITTGFGNPTETLLASGTVGYQITAANSTFRFDFTGDTPPSKADGYIIYGTAFTGSSANSQVAAIQGPWYEIVRVPFTDLASSIYTFDYVDGELVNGTVSFDNDPPPDAEFINTLDIYPFLISTNGQGINVVGKTASTSPGAFVSPIKGENFDAYPNTEKVPTEKGEVIIGSVGAAGRIFVLTSNTLQSVTPTGLPTAPFTCRPFWKRGFQGPYNVCFVGDSIYGFTTTGMFRSIAEGDEGREENDFAANVQTETANWHGAYEFTEYDAQNKEVCFFQSAIRKNDQGYWETDILPYSLDQRDFVPPVVLSDPTRDMIVSGVANVNGHLEFIAGGRREGTTDRWDTFRYDSGAGGVPYYFAFTYSDSGIETTPKIVRDPRPKGLFTDAKVQLYAVTPDSDIDVVDLETGDNPVVEFTLDNSTTVRQYKIFKRKMKNALMWTARIEGTSDTQDEFHELALNVDACGAQR